MRRFLLAPAFAALGFSALAASDTAFVEHFMGAWDLNGDGKVTLAEATERRTDMFAAFDADEDGVLNAEELDMIDAMRESEQAGLGEGAGPGRKRALGSMQRGMMDTDGDGTVSRDEFLSKTPRWFEHMDANADGAITAEDLDAQ